MKLLLLGWFLGFQINVFGQNSFVYNRYSVLDGLNTNKVNCLFQDQKGFLWIGTELGIQRFDGRKFVNFGRDANEGLQAGIGVDQIIEESDHKLWLLQGSRVGLFDTRTYGHTNITIVNSRKIPARNVFKLFKDSKDNIFLCGSHYGLLIFDREKNHFVDYRLPNTSQNTSGVISLHEDVKSGLYYLTRHQGLAIYDPTTGILTDSSNDLNGNPFLSSPKPSDITGLYISKQGAFWIGYWDIVSQNQKSALFQYNPKNQKFIEHKLGNNATQGYAFVNQFLETKNGEFWIGGANILLRYNKLNGEFEEQTLLSQYDYGLNAEDIRQLYEDREGNIWICTENGLYMVNPNSNAVFNYVIKEEKRSEYAINAFIETKNGEKWIGTWGNGLMVYDENFNTIEHHGYSNIKPEEFKSYGKVWDLNVHSLTGNLWTACQDGTIAVFDASSKKSRHWLKPPVFENSTVRQVEEDAEGNLWFATHSGKLVKYEKTALPQNEAFQLIKDFNTIIYRVYLDNKGLLWVGTSKQGIYVLEPKSGKIVFHFKQEPDKPKESPGLSIYDVQQFNDSIFFLGSDVLYVLNKQIGIIKKISPANGLNGSKVTQMTMDDKGLLWLITNNGLSSYNYHRDLLSTYNNLQGVVYAEKTNAFNFKGEDGRIWFGGSNVLFVFDPNLLNNSQRPPKVEITDFRLANKYLPLDSLLAKEKIRFNYHQNSFTIYFSTLNFGQQDKLQFYYRIKGVNSDWVRAEKDLAANYTTLNPGNYVFEIKSSNIQGLESEVTKMKFKISPPFYTTWWFLSLLALLTVSTIYNFYRLRVNRLLAVEKLRNKVARDLHDDMGSTLSTINILSSMAKSKLTSDTVTSSSYISKITDNSQRMMEAMDDIVWSIKPDNDTMQRVVARMREYVTNLLEAKEIKFDFFVENDILELKLDMEARRDLFLIFKEAINNTAKYSKCCNVAISLTKDDNCLKLKIADNGIGFKVNQIDKGNGIDNMKKRAVALKGRIELKSELNKGTSIILIVPVSKQKFHMFM